MRDRRHWLLFPAAVFAGACATLSTPELPQAFEGPLKASADSLVASTLASRCAPRRFLDVGITPQGCLRRGDPGGWVNWTGAGRVVKVAREWIQQDVATALQVGRAFESEITDRLGPPVECPHRNEWTAREIRWITTEPAGITTALIVWDSVRIHTATPRVIVTRTLGPEQCGDRNDRPWP